MDFDWFGDFLSDFLDIEYFGRVTYVGYPHIVVEDDVVHYPCTVQIMEKHGEQDFYWFYGQVYPTSMYHWYGPMLPFSTGE